VAVALKFSCATVQLECIDGTVIRYRLLQMSMVKSCPQQYCPVVACVVAWEMRFNWS